METIYGANTTKFSIGFSLVLIIWTNQFLLRYKYKFYIVVFLIFLFSYFLLIGHIRRRESKFLEKDELKNMKYYSFDHFLLLKSADILHLISAFFIGISWIVAFSIPLEQLFQNNSAYYILSSISQGLAALFALIFSLLLITTQITTKYSFNLIERVFSMYTWLFMVLFAAGILLPLYTLKTNNSSLLDVSLGVCGTNVILLFPFLVYLRNQIDPSQLLKDLSKKAVGKLSILGPDPGVYEREFPNMDYYFRELFNIDSIINRSYRESDYYTFTAGIKELLRIGTNERITNKRAIQEVFILLSCIGAETADYRDTIFQIGLPLEKAAIQAVKSGREFVAYEAMYALGGFIENTLCKELDRKMWHIISGLGSATREAIKNKMEKPAEKGIDFLEEIGKKAAEMNCRVSLIWVFRNLLLGNPQFLKSDPLVDKLICRCVKGDKNIIESVFEHIKEKKTIDYIMNHVIFSYEEYLERKEVRKEFIKLFLELGIYFKEFPQDAFKMKNLDKIKSVLNRTDEREREEAFHDLSIPEIRRQFLLELKTEIKDFRP